MYWDDLNKENIERAKELYVEYIEQNKHSKYRSQLECFDEYLENHVKKCKRCDEWFDEDTMHIDRDNNLLCECCYDDLYTEYVEEDDRWLDHINGVI